MKEMQPLNDELLNSLSLLWGRVGVRKIQDMWSITGNTWIDFADKIIRVRYLDPELKTLITTFCRILSSASVRNDSLSAKVWQWADREKPLLSFSLSNA